MKRDFDLCAIEYPILDMVYTGVKDSLLNELGYNKSDVIAPNASERERILAALVELTPSYIPGGSAANTTTAFAGFGGKAVFIGRFGQDEFGKILQADFNKYNISEEGFIFVSEPTGICLILISEDAERTMFPSVEAGLRLQPDMLNEDLFARSSWILAQAYMLPYSEDLRATLKQALLLAKKQGAKFAFSLSAPGIVKEQAQEIKTILPQLDLCFANEFEAAVLSGTSDPQRSAAFLSQYCPHVVVTAGSQGVWIAKNNEIFNVPAFPCQPLDLTGAGDMYAGAYLYGLVQHMSEQTAARTANYLAMKVISQVGARLDSDLLALWDEAIKVK